MVTIRYYIFNGKDRGSIISTTDFPIEVRDSCSVLASKLNVKKRNKCKKFNNI